MAIIFSTPTAADESEGFDWSRLPSLPDKEGFAGMYAGVIGGSLIAAGGANFPVDPPWQGGRKQFYDSIFVFQAGDGGWKRAEEKLPKPIAYGVSVSCGEGILCIGGCDAQRHYADVFLLRREQGKMTTVSLPSLPKPCAQMCGALAGRVVYVAGGIAAPDAAEALHTFWALDLSVPPAERRWEELPPWPGPERMQAVAAVADGSFFVISGMRLCAGPDGMPRPESPFLRDGYRYTPGKSAGSAGSWRRIADLPRGVAAAPTPAVCLNPARFAVFGGLDASTPGIPMQEAPPLPRPIVVYDAVADAWSLAGEMPEGSSRVTVPAVPWKGGAAVVSGERLPGRRSPEVWLAVPHAKP